MTSQVTSLNNVVSNPKATDCRRPASFPKDYCRKLKSGIARLEASIRLQYEGAFPAGQEWISRALAEARESAWNTPFPSLFFPAYAHLKVNELKPAS